MIHETSSVDSVTSSPVRQTPTYTRTEWVTAHQMAPITWSMAQNIIDDLNYDKKQVGEILSFFWDAPP